MHRLPKIFAERRKSDSESVSGGSSSSSRRAASLKPRLERRNARKNIDYDYSPSSASAPSSSSSSRPIYTFYIGKAQFEIEKTSAGGLRVKVTEEMIARRHREMEAEAEMARQIARVCTTPQLKKENETLVGWRRQWKPKLDTVYEMKGRRPRKILRKTKSNVV
ncbi:hypothetical protein SASPL_111899 [Salvia splendens]|uniref:Uncharacterized protein n=1 Tax=Salvia splendens TaxID=180675 RepID=A0A8X8YDE6_SALSN|nr:hypothetical protein SASPL_111899 [Salvia splendens]